MLKIPPPFASRVLNPISLIYYNSLDSVSVVWNKVFLAQKKKKKTSGGVKLEMIARQRDASFSHESRDPRTVSEPQFVS